MLKRTMISRNKQHQQPQPLKINSRASLWAKIEESNINTRDEKAKKGYNQDRGNIIDAWNQVAREGAKHVKLIIQTATLTHQMLIGR